MEITQFKAIETALTQSISYNDYRTLVKHQADKRKTSGPNRTEALINYTILNDRRMKRWDKTVKVDDLTEATIIAYSKKITWLVLTESWCGDAAHVIPVLNKVAELNPNINLKIVFRDEHEELMGQFLTNGGRAIPKLIMIDNDTQEVIGDYGPRPSEATKLVNDYKTKHGKLTLEFKEDLQRWYNNDKGQTTINDLMQLLNLSL